MTSTKATKKRKGFTMLEVLLSVAIVAALFSISVPLFLSLYRRNDIDVSTNIISQSIRRAQILSQAVDGDTTWGVFVDNGTVTLFKGATYATRDAAFDEIYEISTAINPSGLQEVAFEKFTGEPLQTGTVVLTLNTGEVRNVTINEKGTVGF